MGWQFRFCERLNEGEKEIENLGIVSLLRRRCMHRRLRHSAIFLVSAIRLDFTFRHG